MNNKNQNPFQEFSSPDGRTIGMIAYLTMIGLIVAIVKNSRLKDEFASFHIRQSLGLILLFIAMNFVSMVPVIGWILAGIGNVLIFIMWVIGFMAAVNNKETEVPLLGDQFQEWFHSM